MDDTTTTTTPPAADTATTEVIAPPQEPAPLPAPPAPVEPAPIEPLPTIDEQPAAQHKTYAKPPVGARVLYEFEDPANDRRAVRPADVVNVNDDGTLDLFVLFHPHDRHCGMANQDPRVILKVSHETDPSVEEDFYHRSWRAPW